MKEDILKKIIRKLLSYRYIFHYLIYHKILFRITNTKFDISYCVFRESFIDDQYGIMAFLDRIQAANEILFLDIGRNHGFVFFYAMHHILKTGFDVERIKYIGVDPSPLKFVYFAADDYLESKGIEIEYNLIDRAVTFDQASRVKLKYGEGNFGNFNVSGSNYEQKLKARQSRYDFIDIVVETIPATELEKFLRGDADAIIVKIDCKNRTDFLFERLGNMLANGDVSFLIACERDGSSEHDLSQYINQNRSVLVRSEIRA